LSRRVPPAFEPHRLRAAAALALLLAALFPDVVFRGRVFFERDVNQMLYGQVAAFARCLRMGSLPLWNPWAGFGQPLLANPAAQVAYPWTWLALLLAPAPWYSVYVLGHLLLAGLGVHALARQLGTSTAGALLAAAVFSASGPLLSFVSLWHHLAGACWMPWVLVAAGRLARDARPAAVLAWALALTGQVLAGSADMCAMTGLLAVAYAAACTAERRFAPPPLARVAGRFAAGVLLAVGLSAVLWVPALDLVRSSDRSALAAGLRTFWSLHPANLLQALVPVFPDALPLLPTVRSALFESREPFLPSVYLGAATLPFVVAAIAGPARRTAMTVSGVGVLAALVTLGRYGVLYDWAVRLLPPLQSLRYPSKAAIVLALAWALVAGLGLDAWRARDATPGVRAAVLAGAAAGCALLLAATFVAWFRAADVARLFLTPDPAAEVGAHAIERVGRTLAMSSLAAAAVLVVAVTLRGANDRQRALVAAAAGVAVADLVLVHGSLNPTAPRALLDAPPAVVAAIEGPAPTRIHAFDYAFRLLGKTYRRTEPAAVPPDPAAGIGPKLWATLARQDALLPPLAERFGLFGSFEYDYLSLYPRPLRNLTLVFRAAEETPEFVRLLERGGVDYVVALHREGLEDLEAVATRTSRFAGDVFVFRTPRPLPRTFVASGVRVGEGLPAIRALAAPDFDPRSSILLSEAAPRDPSPTFRGTARLAEYRPDRVVIESDLGEPGYLVLLDAYDAGWRARVDAAPAPVLRANVAFRAVAVGPGTHRVELDYRPAAVEAGVGISAASGALALGVAVVSRRREAARGAPNAVERAAAGAGEGA
jgi:hypothetical protein